MKLCVKLFWIFKTPAQWSDHEWHPKPGGGAGVAQSQWGDLMDEIKLLTGLQTIPKPSASPKIQPYVARL